MRCHDILGIRENATAEQIEAAYSEKTAKLEAGADVLSPTANERKHSELSKARVSCLTWLEKQGIQRIRERITEEIIPRPNEFRTYACCCGPMTLAHNLCCSPCGLTAEGTFCIAAFADLAIYGVLGHAFVEDRKFWNEIAEQEEKKERAAEARKAIDRIESELMRCQMDQIEWAEIVRQDKQQLEYVRAYADLFTAMGAENAREMVHRQEQRLIRSSSRLAELKQQENDYRREIRQQKSKL